MKIQTKNKNGGYTLIELITAIWLVLVVAFMIGLGVVAFHFIMKIW
jgi:type II secretory pathway pseudopilin PulG